MHKKLNKISNINSGYTFRKTIEKDDNGDIYLLQARNIILNEDISNVDDFLKINSTSIRNPYFLEYNDIVVVSKGFGMSSFRSAIFVSNEKNVIAPSSVLIIRISDITVLPKYVSLYLNSLDGQKAISKIVTGSHIQNILVRNLLDLEIPIPSVNEQKLIIDLSENLQRQEKLLNKKLNIQKNILDSIFINLTNK